MRLLKPSSIFFIALALSTLTLPAVAFWHGSGGGIAPVCGAPTGQMDFSVCSNIGIMAAL